LLSRKASEAGGQAGYQLRDDGGDANGRRWPPGRDCHQQCLYKRYQYRSINAIPIKFCSTPAAAPRVYGHHARRTREGWLTLFLRQGFATYGVDRVNTGRSGTDICKINAVRLGRAPISNFRQLTAIPSDRLGDVSLGPTLWRAVSGHSVSDRSRRCHYPQTVALSRPGGDAQFGCGVLGAPR
jgi:hypothetical protein